MKRLKIDPLNKSLIKCTIYTLLLFIVMCIVVYLMVAIEEIILPLICLILISIIIFKLINKESKDIERYLEDND